MNQDVVARFGHAPSSWRNLCPQLCGHKLREMAHIRGRNDAVGLWHVEGESLGGEEHIAVQLAGRRGGRPGLARLGPQATAEPERGIREGEGAFWYDAAERLDARQACGIAHAL